MPLSRSSSHSGMIDQQWVNPKSITSATGRSAASKLSTSTSSPQHTFQRTSATTAIGHLLPEIVCETRGQHLEGTRDPDLEELELTRMLVA